MSEEEIERLIELMNKEELSAYGKKKIADLLRNSITDISIIYKLEAKVKVYEEIISKSNFAPMIKNTNKVNKALGDKE